MGKKMKPPIGIKIKVIIYIFTYNVITNYIQGRPRPATLT